MTYLREGPHGTTANLKLGFSSACLNLGMLEKRAAPAARRSDAIRRFALVATPERVLLLVSLYWALAANTMFLGAALKGRAPLSLASWGLAGALGIALVALHFVLLALVTPRVALKPVLSVMIVGTALATWFMQRFGIVLDPTMLRNVLRTDLAESRELLSGAMLLHLAVFAGLPLAWLWKVRLVDRPWGRAAVVRAGAVLAGLAVMVGMLFAVFPSLSSKVRNQREMRYMVTPANYLWSLGSVVAADLRGAAAPRRTLGLDAAQGAGVESSRAPRPKVLVLVVGETVRAANWGLDGYRRQTTPQLAQLPVINFTQVTSCGTNTEVSLPCMFAPVGRRNYDEATIRNSDSLLHVLARAGVQVAWRDNQSGCKGVCTNLPFETVQSLNPPGLCADDRCLDEGLLWGLDASLANAHGVQLRVLHQLGNHGPAYFRRYPKAFARFQPACEDEDLHHCTREQIVNAYDNAILYTDDVLAKLIKELAAHADRVDAAVVYLSDHGESLGENQLYLHGMPYAVAPDVQTHVPMVMWMSDGFAASTGIDTACLRQRAAQPASQDHLFHTLLGLLDVGTALYEPEWDLAARCRPRRDMPLAAR
jgi:lipid A ethanolaminephosphotransferase